MAIFEDVFAGVPIGETEIEDFFAVEFADAAWAGAKAVDEPGEFIEFGRLENFYAARIFGDPFA